MVVTLSQTFCCYDQSDLCRLRSVKSDLCRFGRHVEIPVYLSVHGVVFALDEERVLAHLLGHDLVEILGLSFRAWSRV
jgi:hypothetical protein